MGFNAARGYPGQEYTFKPDCPATIWVMHPWPGQRHDTATSCTNANY
jgi:hypothetical protein